jgi:hypothetical protein
MVLLGVAATCVSSSKLSFTWFDESLIVSGLSFNCFIQGQPLFISELKHIIQRTIKLFPSWFA